MGAATTQTERPPTADEAAGSSQREARVMKEHHAHEAEVVEEILGPVCEECFHRGDRVRATMMIDCHALRFRGARCGACGEAVIKQLIGTHSFAVSPMRARSGRPYSLEILEGR